MASFFDILSRGITTALNPVGNIANTIASAIVSSQATKERSAEEARAELERNSEGTIQIYNELAHRTKIYLTNDGNFSSEQYYINPAAILNLTIEDCVLDWVAKGSITFLYFPNKVESDSTGNPANTPTAGAIAQNTNTLNSFNFRGDGYDILRVYIYPLATDGDMKIDESDPKWRLSYAFSIYDIEDVVDVPNLAKNLPLKCAKLYFRDIRAQILNSVNLEYSTATSTNYVPNLASGLDNEGTLKTGEAMLDILKKTFTELTESGGSAELIKGTEESWDLGQADLFYTSPAEYTAAEDLQYLYNHHISANGLQGASNDLCLMHTQKLPTQSPGDLETLSLTPLMDFFTKAGKDSPGELQLEHFTVTKSTGRDGTSNADSMRAPEGGSEFKSFKHGQIMQYSFVDMAPETNTQAFNTTPVYSVNIKDRVFKTTFSNNDVATSRSAISQSYISLLKTQGGGDSLFLPTVHMSKDTLNIFPRYSLNGDNDLILAKPGFHNLLYTGLFHNACICFKTLGLTLRKSGTFIGIDETGGCEDTDYNNKVYGQWFVIKVEHVFEAGAHLNNIYAIKLHRYTNAEESFNSTM